MRRETVYSILNSKAKSWWYHKQLRERGNATEARQLERQSILSSARDLSNARKNGGLLSIGLGGHLLYPEPNCTVSGYEDADGSTARACRILGIPVLDKREAVSRNPAIAYALPMFGFEPSKCPEVSSVLLSGLQGSFKTLALARNSIPGFSGLDTVDRDTYIALWTQAGAKLA